MLYLAPVLSWSGQNDIVCLELSPGSNSIQLNLSLKKKNPFLPPDSKSIQVAISNKHFFKDGLVHVLYLAECGTYIFILPFIFHLKI